MEKKEEDKTSAAEPEKQMEPPKPVAEQAATATEPSKVVGEDNKEKSQPQETHEHVHGPGCTHDHSHGVDEYQSKEFKEKYTIIKP